jgi:queuosine precursor transporter
MSITLLILWIIGVAAVTLVGSFYARKLNSDNLLVGLYVTFIMVAQILAAKISAFDLGFKTFYGPTGVIVFAVTFLLTDIVNEKFGRLATQKMIFIGFVSQVAMVSFFWLGTKFPPAPFWTIQGAWEQIFGLVPRITFASWIAFLVSENTDAYIFAWFKEYTGGKHLWMRNVFSTIPSLALDSLIFIPIAFAGVLPLAPLILSQLLVKWLVGVICVPFMYLNRAILYKKAER